MPNWRTTNRGYSMSRGITRSSKVELWYADDLPLIDNAAPNKAAIFTSFGLPPRGAPSDDPDLTGAIVIDHQMVGPAIVLPGATVARATVAVIYDSDVRFRFDPRIESSITSMEPRPTTVPVIHTMTLGPGQITQRREEKSFSRAQFRKVVVVRVPSQDDDALADQIASQLGAGYVFGTIPYILDQFGIRSSGTGEVRISYGFWSMAKVKGAAAGAFGGTHTAIPSLLNLEEYAPNEADGTVGVRTAADGYDPGATLPGGIG